MDRNGSEVGDRFRAAVGRGFDDAEIRLFRYHLLRLTTVGLTREDIDALRELGQLAFARADLTDQVQKIVDRADASPLAVAIATIVGENDSRNQREAVLGAVLGAYTALGSRTAADELSAAITGAIGGAVAMVVANAVEAQLEHTDLTEYFSGRER